MSLAQQTDTIPLTQAFHLLATTSLGRIVFSRHGLPSIRPSSHLVEDGDIIVRTQGNAIVTTSHDPFVAYDIRPTDADNQIHPGWSVILANTIVAYQVDTLDPETHRGWNVTVTGTAFPIREGSDVGRYRARLHAWFDAQPDKDELIRIQPGIVTGYSIGGIG